MVSRGDPENRADGRANRAADLGHDRQRLAGRPRSLPGAGMNDHGEADRQGAPGALPARSSRQERRQGAPATAADAGELVEARGDIVGRFGGSLELIVQVLRRFVPDMADLFAQLERQLGEGDVRAAPRPCIPSRAALPPLAPAPWPAVPASWSRPCAAPIRGAVCQGPPASASTNCAPCAMPACSACRRCSATCRRSRRAEPGAVACPAKDSGGPGLACIRCGL